MKQNAVVVSPKLHGDNFIQDGPSGIVRVRLNYKDFSAAATTVNLDSQLPDPWTKFPPGLQILGAWIINVANWGGGSISAATLSAGTTSSATAYVAAVSVFSGSPVKLPGNTLVAGTFINNTSPWLQGTVRVQLVLTGGNANTLTSGKADLFLNLRAVSVRTV